MASQGAMHGLTDFFLHAQNQSRTDPDGNKAWSFICLICHHTGEQKIAFCTTWLRGFISHFIFDPGRKTS